MIVNNVNLEVVSGSASQFPDTNLLEIAFAGKSNVGKSSLINALINRKSYARTSSQPGKTQTINFYNVEDKLYFVDLPGYGYAKVSKQERERWGKFIESYLYERQQLKQILLLVDIRHEPNNNDKMLYDWIVYNGFAPIVIATKLDKLKRSQVDKHVSVIKKAFNIKDRNRIVPFSATTKQGKDELWEMLDSIIDSDN
ncbi:putative GTP-binding protein EngB [Vallitalea longa]|uniref:Probable GTP-binding protein EngB n=1 Tax=Vallitalea longa TaxID=2936439 RepID=A0A9W6DE76_9FIRM|nr:ribosome biogenesis GTP-binding protein YihA/YsxC [Vallitalea longa]GKX28113.1 putative GTP-binding protein EngB [Vallitalea longa]